MKRTTRIVMLVALLAASLNMAACTGTNLYTGVDSNGGWSTPTGGYVTGGIAGYPF